MTTEPSKAKTTIFNFDGTGNEPADAGEFVEHESITNVLKLPLLLGGGLGEDGTCAGPGAVVQRAFYYNGIGTREGGRMLPGVGWLVRGVNKMFAPSWGHVGRILREAIDDFEGACCKDDRVVVFGYSRGAALARKFVSTILRKEMCKEVQFLGVFDTVAAMDGTQRPGEDIATDVVFEDGTLHEGVKRAVHIVALDEDRLLFRPTLINKDTNHPDRITEVWFPGVHGGRWRRLLARWAIRSRPSIHAQAVPRRIGRAHPVLRCHQQFGRDRISAC